jgi:alpha-ketoglutarate-dependent 2,4-dichlorophenoxyacetate dioxygenase
MPLTIAPVTPSFAAEVGDVDLSRPLSAGELAEVREAFAAYAVLVFPSQQLSVEQHLAFAARFGPLERSVASQMKDQTLRVRADIADIANLDAQGRLWAADSRLRQFQLGNRLWHTDSSFKQPTAYTSMLYARSVAPVGGHTEFADMRAAWDALPEPMRARVEGLVAEHSLLFSRAKLGFTNFTDDEKLAFAPVARPLVRTIPENGRRSLYVASHVGRIRGMADAEALALVEALVAHATQRQFVYTHRWRVGDLVMWDNRCTMHRGTPFDDLRWPRDMMRATTSDRPDWCEPEAVQTGTVPAAAAQAAA